MGVPDVRIGRDGWHDPRIPAALEAALTEESVRSPERWPQVARDLGAVVPHPAAGRTAELWSVLATLGSADLQVARAVEPHVDALAILAEADAAGHEAIVVPGASWGVFAAEGPDRPLRARSLGSGWRLDGTKHWCSLADRLSHALVTAWVDEDRRGLFAVDLTEHGVDRSPEGGAWHARGLRDVVSNPITLRDVAARPVGPAGWYLERDGFAWGGIGVAAVWYGGAVGLARRLTGPRSRPRDQISHQLLGRVDRCLQAARAVLHRASVEIDSGRAGGERGVLLALRVRGVVADAAEDVLEAVGHELGPGPLVADPEHAARDADLRLYLRQHHAERDLAALGRLVADGQAPW